MTPIKVAIVGATGYTGSELVRLLTNHPFATIEAITSESRAGEPFSRVHPAFRGIEDRPLMKIQDLDGFTLDLVFLALPHGVSMSFVRDHGVDRFRTVDLSGDFRLDSAKTYEEWYGLPHAIPELLDRAVFGLPELNRGKVREARLVANPGCYPTASTLALLPLLAKGLVEPDGIVVDAKSGVTGAGAKAKASTHFPDVFGNFNAYGLLRHRHTPEIEATLSTVAGQPIQLLFTPHLLPIDRGILATAYARPVDGVNDASLKEAYADFYRDEPFVRVVDTPPTVKQVRGSNYCDVFVTHDSRTDRVVALAAIDNLVKGAAGQAVQNMNLMFGFAETAGLEQGPLHP